MRQVSTSLKLEKNVFITSNITNNERPVKDDNATMIASLALLPLSWRCLALIPHVITPLAKLPCSCPLHCCILEAVDCRVISCVQHQSPITPILMLQFWRLSWLSIWQWIPVTRRPLTRMGMGGGGYGGWGGGLEALIHIISGHMWVDPLTKNTFKRVVCRWYNILGGFGVGTTNPTARIIPPNVGVMTMRLFGASSGHRRWYGQKLPAIMISRKRDAICEIAVKKRAVKVS
jgi:hypothetical protein